MNQLTQLTHDEIDNIINLAKAHAKTVYDRNNNKAKEKGPAFQKTISVMDNMFNDILES